MTLLLAAISICMLLLGIFLWILIPRSLKIMAWCVTWAIILVADINSEKAVSFLKLFGIYGVTSANLIIEVILFSVALVLIIVYISYIGTELRKLTEIVLGFLSTKRTRIEKLSLVLPAYNEEQNLVSLISFVIEMIRSFPLKIEIVLVNDGSTDDTGKICEGFAHKYNFIKAINHATNLGKLKAFETGITHAEGDAVILMETDWQYDPRDILVLLHPLEEGFEISNGWRVQRRDPFHRIILSKGYNLMLRSFFDTGFRDHNSGYKAFKREVALKLCAKINTLKLYGPHRFILILAKQLGYEIAEVPVRHYRRRGGVSYISPFKTPLKVLYDAIKMRYLLTYRKEEFSIRACV